MGLLDDAIREHLDLKRRRGADPTEIERAEREALGPVRRSPEPESAEIADDDAAYDAESEQGWHEPFGDEADELPPASEDIDRHYSPSELFERAARPLDDEQARADDPPPPEEAGRGDFFAEDPLGDPFAEDDRPATPPPHPAPEPRSPESAGGETVEYRLDEAHETEPKKEGEDVLEETPEFLQDTPDHDRLWFEQRPPKDFDFEG